MRNEKELDQTLLVAPIQATDVRMMAKALEDAGALHKFVTLTAPSDWQRRVLSRMPGFTRYSRRLPTPVAKRRTKQIVMGDLVMKMGRAMGYTSVDVSDMALACVDRAAASIIKPPVGTVLAREDGCIASFTEAQKRGIRRIYQLPTAYFETVRQLMAKEAEIFPELCATHDFNREFSEARNERKACELSLCDAVLCPSAFVQNSLPAGACEQKSLKTLPFGFDSSLMIEENDRRDPLFLYAGNISVRKGVHRVLRAWKRLRAHQTHKLLLVGDMQLNDGFLNEFKGIFEHKPRLPFPELQAVFRKARAFVFNAMADGFGLVISEAMCASTPVLASRNCGAPDILKDGTDGRLFDYADDDALDQTLDWALGHPSELRAMGRSAFKRASAWTWDEYKVHFIEWISNLSRSQGKRSNAGT